MQAKVLAKEISAEEWLAPLDAADKNDEFIAMESRTFLKDAWIRFKKNKRAMLGLIFLTFIVLLAIFGPMLSSYTYDQQDFAARNLKPSMQHLFGTDKFGRDIYTRVLYGARISLAVGFVASIINMCIGIVFGGISGFIGGYVDLIMMRIVDIIYAIPSMLYVILIMLIMGSNIYSILIGICISSWVGMARIVRSQVLSLKEQEFSLAAFVLGSSKARILFKHLIINVLGPIIVNVTFMIPQAIFTEAFLSFVGIGISAPMASWGTLANEARLNIELYPTQIIFPIIAICLTIFSLNFIGEGLGDALDPKQNRG